MTTDAPRRPSLRTSTRASFSGTSASARSVSTASPPSTRPSRRTLRASPPPRARSTFDVRGQGKLYYEAELRYVSTALPTKPSDRGFFVQKLLRSVSAGGPSRAMKTIPAHSETGSPASRLVLVDILLESAEPHEQVVIEDPLPGGVEPMDFALDTSAVGDQESWTCPTRPRSGRGHAMGYGAFRVASGMHREMHDDKVLTFLPHLDPGIYHFRYLVRATTPGTFVAPPTRAACMYSPEVWGQTAASQFTVSEKVASQGKTGSEGGKLRKG